MRMGKDACLDFCPDASRTKPRRAALVCQRRRIADECRAIDATELQRFVSLNAIALGAAFHFISSRGNTHALHKISEARIAADRIPNGLVLIKEPYCSRFQATFQPRQGLF